MYKKVLALVLFCYGHCVAVHAATDCVKEQLGDDESLSSYLEAYAAACLDESLKKQLQSYGLPPDVTPPTGAHWVRMTAAWGDISTTFAKLRGDRVVGPKMEEVFGALQARALATGQDLLTVLQGSPVPDVSPLRQDGWKIQAGLLILEIQTNTGVTFPDLDIGAAMDADCPTGGGPLCTDTLKKGRELMRQWKLADRLTLNVSSETIITIQREVVRKDALWNTYLYDSKPMLPFDFAFTDFVTGGWSNSDQYSGGFREPPRTQWFLLHPSFGLEYISSVPDGEQLKPMLLVEIIGANRWNTENRWLDMPLLRHLSGASFIASYADRAGAKDTGYGALLTFGNVYSIGAARYGDKTSLILSIDLANLIREKYKPRYEKYKEQIDQFKSQLP